MLGGLLQRPPLPYPAPFKPQQFILVWREKQLKRTTIAAILLCAFLIGLLCSGVTASTTVKEVTVSTDVSLWHALYSLSSPATLVLPLLLVLALIALVSFIGKQPNVGFLFTAISTVLFIGFLIWYASETRNQSQYTILSDMLKEQGVSFKKRDVHISVSINPLCFLTLAVGLLACALSFPTMKSAATRYRLKQELEPYAYIAPHLFLFVVFFLVPAIYGIYAAFTKWDLYNEPVFAGLSNLKTILFDSSNTYYHSLRNGLWNTVQFVLYSVPFCIIVPLALALAMRAVGRGKKLYQAIYYLPSLMSASTVMLAWKYFFHATYGMMNNFFMSTANWFSPPHSWIMLVMITVWWCNGGTMVIYQSALASIPEDYYEAASIDGANAIGQFLHITLPSMRYPLMYTLVTQVVAQFNVFAQPDLLTKYDYGAGNAVLMMYIRDTAFGQGVAGIASAMALVLGVVIMAITSVQIRIMRENNA